MALTFADLPISRIGLAAVLEGFGTGTSGLAPKRHAVKHFLATGASPPVYCHQFSRRGSSHTVSQSDGAWSHRTCSHLEASRNQRTPDLSN
jgi:hypothetical protein